MQFLAPNALSFVQTSLGSTYSQSLGPAATASVTYLENLELALIMIQWADTVKFTTPYIWYLSTFFRYKPAI